jgi:hypothetical protein
LVACRFASLKYAGTVVTASVIFSPRYDSAPLSSFCRMNALICWGENLCPSMVTVQLPLDRTDRLVHVGDGLPFGDLADQYL